MTLGEKQKKFTYNIAQLIFFALRNGFEFTFGEVYRTLEQQKIYFDTGRSKTMNSRHLDRLAVDFNIFKDGKMLFSDKPTLKQDLQIALVLGDYWISLNTDNVWGGDWNRNHNALDESFQDPYHFEMKP